MKNHAAMVKPTRKGDWVQNGDRCENIISGARGVVVYVRCRESGTVARVRWDSGYEGNTTIAFLRRVEG